MTYPTKNPEQRTATLDRAALRAARCADPRKTKRIINMAIQHARAGGAFVPRDELRRVRQFAFVRFN